LLKTKTEMEENPQSYMETSSLSPSPHTPPNHNDNTSNKINELRKMLGELEHEMEVLGYPLPKESVLNRSLHSLDILKTYSLPASPLSYTPSITPPLTTPNSPRDEEHQQTQTQTQTQQHSQQSANQTTQSLFRSTSSIEPPNISAQPTSIPNNEQPSHHTKIIHSSSQTKNLHPPTRNDFTNTLSLNPQIYQPKYNTFMHELHELHAKMKSVKGFLDLKTKNTESNATKRGFPLNRVGLGMMGNDLSRGRSRSFIGYNATRNLTPAFHQIKESSSSNNQ